MLSISDIKVGTIFKYEGAPYQAVSVNHSKQARSAAVLQTKIKNLETGSMLEKNFKSSDKFDEADLTRKKANYLYREGDKYFFMDDETYDQFFLEKEMLGDKMNFIKESLQVKILYFDDRVIGIELPPKVELKVTEAPEGIRGDSTGNVTKTIEVETGYRLNAPMFIKEGEIIRINTETGEYVERV